MSRTRLPLRAEALEDRLAPALALDPRFGDGGKLIVPAGSVNLISEIAFVAEGKYAIAGSTANFDFAAARLNHDGTPDGTFGTGGSATLRVSDATDFVNAQAVQRDGTVVLAGSGFVVQSLTGIAAAVVRLTADGQRDTTFGFGGTAFVTVEGRQTVATAVAVQSDGGIVLAGLAGDPTTGDSIAVVARLTSEGRLDPAFGTNGVTTFQVGGNDDLQALALQPDGSIVVVGTTAPSGTEAAGSLGLLPGGDILVARLTPAGQLDPTFGTGGTAVIDFGGSDSGRAVTVLANGKIAASGMAGTAFAVVRLNADGSLDDTFGTGGKAAVDLGTRAFLTTIEYPPGQEIILAGSAGELATDFAVVRLTADGRPDETFAPGGKFTLDLGGADIVRTIFPQPDGRLFLLGATGDHSFAQNQLATVVIGDFPLPILVGGRTDGTAVVLTAPDGTYRPTGTADFFPGVPVGIRTATADVNGDGTPDLIGGAGPGALPSIMVLDGRTGAFLTSPLAFEASFTGGVFVAGADLDGDGRAEIIATPDQGGGPNVVIFSLNPDGTTTPPKTFFALGNPEFRGGARPAVGDVNGDGTPDLIVGAGFLGGPNVEIHDGRALMAGDFDALIGSGFFAFDGSDATTLRNGVFLASGDVDGDGFDDVIAGGGPGGGPRVLILSGRLLAAGDVAGAYADPVANFFTGSTADRGGVRVAATDTDEDGRADLIVGSGEGQASEVQVYLGAFLAPGIEPIASQNLDPLGLAPPGGVFVG